MEPKKRVTKKRADDMSSARYSGDETFARKNPYSILAGDFRFLACVEAVEIHDFGPGFNEVFNEDLFLTVHRIGFRHGAQL